MALATLTCAIAIILSAAWYVLSWRLGIPALTVAVIVFLVIGIVTTMAANIERMIRTGGIGILAPRWLAEGPWFYHILLLAAALAAFYGLMQLAFRVKRESEA